MSIELLKLFIQDNLAFILLGLALLLIIWFIQKVLKIIKALVTILLVCLGIYFYSQYEAPQQTIGELMVSEITENAVGRDLVQDLVNQGISASYKSNGNGAFTISAGGIFLTGSNDSPQVTIKHGGVSTTIEKTKIVEAYINMVRTGNFDDNKVEPE